jgi:hypothetical protein
MSTYTMQHRLGLTLFRLSTFIKSFKVMLGALIAPKQGTEKMSYCLLGHACANDTLAQWWVVRGSNPRPTRCKRVALPAELTTLFIPAFLSTEVTIDNADPYIGPALKKID